MANNHPNRGTVHGGSNPTAQEIRDARIAANLSQSQASRLVFASTRTWQGYESDEGEPAHRRMHGGLWLLFRTRVALLNGDRAGALRLLRDAL